ncbi:MULTISPECIES: DUF342 domain-containing protein [unclassified Fusibacter]|uniref:DUF342 domain-containing protein n=1 Tax=unclassified Fusibacter TaxID=2624464 RepID=UPI001010C6F7|nr:MULTISPECIES: FapA family protein [unclassified Fusibacter]MCK8058257.1 FapA family protein [Fusibacter sp. A2]NPE20840.1 DUF342 domain-containing protein [Fusibacter sp. A1]RXV63045.1 DUF342 domain-containing protein [Fusibacter sp. A1]
MDLFQNDYFRLYLDGINVFIAVVKVGYDLKSFTEVTEILPRLKLTNFGNLNRCITGEVAKPLIIGVYRDKIEIEITRDELEAFIKLNMTSEDCGRESAQLMTEMVEAVKARGITTGIVKEVFKPVPDLGKRILVAKGVEPVPGEDATVSYYRFSQKKPLMLSNGNVNHYELNLIDNVNVGEWLGEKTPATIGKAGTSVFGLPVPAKVGRDITLKYDHRTVACTTSEGGKSALYALKDGAVKMLEGKIMVDNHLKVDGDVDYTTGNIDFDGYVTITGVVKDGFSVVAENDITINGDMGVGAINVIQSKQGNIFIKGGVNGKNTARIIAGQNVYLKYVNEAKVTADNIINIGFYAMDSDLKAKKLIVSPEQGRIIGGKVEVKHQIITGTIGNRSERRTDISVTGFERGCVKDELEAALIKYNELHVKGNRLKKQLEIFEGNMERLDEKGLNTYKGMVITYEHLMDETRRLESNVEMLEEILKTRGDGEVRIHQNAFPKTCLVIKNLQKRIKDSLSGSFYVENNSLHFE